MQTLGHMEFVLKYPEWAGLREMDSLPSSMCPSHPEALPLVQALLKQVLALHRPAQLNYVHIGADEVLTLLVHVIACNCLELSAFCVASVALFQVWHMGLCSSCSRRAVDSKYGKAVLFLEHVTAVARFLKETHPHLKVIMWDDMLRNIDAQVMQGY